MKSKAYLGSAMGLALFMVAGAASASLSTSFQFNGKGNWSIDAVGGNGTPVGDLTAVVPTGSTVVKAFLYSSTNHFNDGPPAFGSPTVNFDGTVISGADWTNLGTNEANTLNFGLTAFRRDVTAQVAAKVGGGSATPFTFAIQSENPTGNIDGEVLAIIYSNPAEQTRTIAFQDGFSASTGDMTSINLAEPLTAAQLGDPSFEALMSAGIGFGFQGSDQFSEIDVNGERLTSSAGGQDDGAATNGALITVGGIGDDPANPVDPNAGPANDPRTDDELYTLTPFLDPGDSVIEIDTLNPSNDDNIFFLAFNLTAVAGVDQPPPPPDDQEPPEVPEPATILMLGAGLAGLAAFGRRRRQ